YEGIAQTNDSILKIVNLSENDRLAYFETFVEQLKTQVEEQKEKQEAQTRNQGLITVNNSGNAATSRAGGSTTQAVSFYFYNSTTVAYGKNEFIKVWGNRSLEDDWRWSTKSASNTSSNVSVNNVIASATENELFDPQYYISKIPSEERAIDSILKERNY